MRLTDTARSIFIAGFILLILTFAMALSESVEDEFCQVVKVTKGNKGEDQIHQLCNKGTHIYKKVSIEYND